MVIFTLGELFDAIIMTVAVGFIFSGLFKTGTNQSRFDWQTFKISVIVTCPAIILHELAHKFAALSFGLSATFNAAYVWLAIGLALSLLKFPFLFFVPAYVSIGTGATPLQSAIIAFAGPGLNGLLWLTAAIALRSKKLGRGQFVIWQMTRQINKLLFFFNLIPFGPFDGAKVFEGLRAAFF